MNITDSNTLCIGCGICGGLCNSSIQMSYGKCRNTPLVDNNKCVDCGICMQVCPFINETPLIRQKNYNPYVGYYECCYIGKVDKFLPISASGGITTAFLIDLLRNEIVDSVVTVRKRSDPEQLFEYFFAKSEKDLLSAAGSAYYPVDISKAISQIKKSHEKVAIVGLPCVLRGIRNAMKVSNALRSKIVMLIGLTCGGLSEKQMIEYVALEGGFQPGLVNSVSFRRKRPPIACKNCMMCLEFNDGSQYESYYYTPESLPDADSSFGKAYLNKLFLHDACMVCTDAFAEYSDITFMDAWLPELENESYGTSMVVARTMRAAEICEHLHKLSGIKLRQISIDDVIRAQRNVNVVQSKKQEAHYRRLFYKGKYRLPAEHSLIKDISSFRKAKLFVKSLLQLRLQKYAKSTWPKVMDGTVSLKKFDCEIQRRLYH